MLTPRNAIIAASLLFACYVLSSVLSSLTPPGSKGSGADSYGTGREGGRALIELLAELGVPVERWTEPRHKDLPLDASLLLMTPDPVLIRTEPEPLRRAAEWVRAGGRVVVAPGFLDGSTESQLDRLSEELEHYDANLLETLGLEDVSVDLMLSSDVPENAPPDDDELVLSTVAKSSTGPAADRLDQLVTLGAALPEVLWDEEERTTLWETRILDADGYERVLGTAFGVGAGEVVILSDETLVSNVTLPRGSNALWLVDILTSGSRRRVIVDEFYHGLNVRGNAWWLLTKRPYACLALCGLLLLGLWSWRQGVLLGPPLADRTPTRRDIGEYIDAVGRFFLRGRDANRFLLAEVRGGVWRRLSEEFGLPPGQDDVERLAAAVQRRDVDRAEKVRAAFPNGDALAQQSKASAEAVFSALQELVATLPATTPLDEQPAESATLKV